MIPTCPAFHSWRRRRFLLKEVWGKAKKKKKSEKSLDLPARMPSELIIKELNELQADKGVWGGWKCESDCNEVNGARVMPHHPAPTAPHPPIAHRASLPLPPCCKSPRALGQKILKNRGTSFSRTIRRLSPLVPLFTDCYRHHQDGGEAIFCKQTFILNLCS